MFCFKVFFPGFNVSICFKFRDLVFSSLSILPFLRFLRVSVIDLSLIGEVCTQRLLLEKKLVTTNLIFRVLNRNGK